MGYTWVAYHENFNLPEIPYSHVVNLSFGRSRASCFGEKQSGLHSLRDQVYRNVQTRYHWSLGCTYKSVRPYVQPRQVSVKHGL